MVGWMSEIISADTEVGSLGLNLLCFQEGPHFHGQENGGR